MVFVTCGMGGGTGEERGESVMQQRRLSPLLRMPTRLSFGTLCHV